MGLLFVDAVRAEVVTYPAPTDASLLSTDYVVEVDGKPVPVYHIVTQWQDGKYSMATFDFSGAVTVKIKTDRPLKNLTILPAIHGIKPAIEKGEATFTANRPFKISFEPTGSDSPLLIFANAIEKVLPSVVNIATATIVEYHDFYDTLLHQFYGVNRPGRRQEQPDSIGSGVIVDEDGYILTNFHVLRRASRVQVKLWDGRIYDAEPLVVYTAPKDVALLKIRAKPGEKFKAIKFAKDDDLLLGETVVPVVATL